MAPEFERRMGRGAADPIEERTSLNEEDLLSLFSFSKGVMGERITPILPRSPSGLEPLVSNEGREEERART